MNTSFAVPNFVPGDFVTQARNVSHRGVYRVVRTHTIGVGGVGLAPGVDVVNGSGEHSCWAECFLREVSFNEAARWSLG